VTMTGSANEMRRWRRWLLALAVLLGLPLAAARADVLHLKDGTTLEGKILSETSSTVEIQTVFGVAKIARSKIKEIERKKTPKEEYQARRAELKDDDVNGRFELAMFCKENKMGRESRELLKEILELSPQHSGANRELGNIEYHGRWFDPKDLEKFKEEERKEMEAAGMVLHDGEWMTKDEAMKAQGYVLVDGQWLERKVADRLAAQRDFEEVFGVPLTISDSEHFSVRNTRTDEANQYLLDVCEDAYAHFVSLAKPDEKEEKFLSYYPYHIYILDSPAHCNKFIESGFIDRYTPPKDTKERYLDCTNFSYFFPQPFMVIAEGRHLASGGDRETALTGMVMIHLGQTFIRRLRRGGAVASWIEAGFAHYFEGEFNHYATVSVVQYPHYEPYVDKWIDGWETFPRWYEKLSDPATQSRLLTVKELTDTPIEELRVDNLAKSWSLVCFLLATKPEPLFAFARNAKKTFRGEKIPEAEAFQEAFGSYTMADLDREWATWIRQPENRHAGSKPGGGGILK